MATLEEAARQLLDQLTELDGGAEDATRRLNKLKEKLEATEKDLDDRIKELEGEVKDFLDKVRAQTTEFAGEVDEAHQALTQAQQAVVGASEASRGAIQAAEKGTRALAEAVAGVEEPLETLVTTRSETPATQLGEQARDVGGAIDEALTATRDGVAEAVTDVLVELQGKVGDTAEALGQVLEKAEEHINEAFVEWTSHLFEVSDLIQNKGFEPAQENAEQTVEYAVEQCEEGLEKEVERALQRMDTLAEEFESLQKAIDEAAGDVREEVLQPLAAGMNDLQDALAGAVNWLDEVREWLASYTFMQ